MILLWLCNLNFHYIFNYDSGINLWKRMFVHIAGLDYLKSICIAVFHTQWQVFFPPIVWGAFAAARPLVAVATASAAQTRSVWFLITGMLKKHTQRDPSSLLQTDLCANDTSFCAVTQRTNKCQIVWGTFYLIICISLISYVSSEFEVFSPVKLIQCLFPPQTCLHWRFNLSCCCLSAQHHPYLL